MSERIDSLTPDLFINSPAEFLIAEIVASLKGTEQWFALFGEAIEPYERMDFDYRDLPALRVFNVNYSKTSESWFIEGSVIIDILFPAALRRDQLEQYADTVSSALLQQFRRPNKFQELCDKVPGLNELGKTFDVDKSLMFNMGGDDQVPLTRINANFRIDLREWDKYLESDDRTKDDPFERTLGNLKKIAFAIKALNDDGSVNVTIPTTQKIT